MPAKTVALTGVRRKARTRLGGSQQRFVWAALSPCILFYLVFRWYPLLDALNLSFREFNLIVPQKPFVGLQNYSTILSSPLFWKCVGNTFYYAVFATAGTLATALVLAILINSVPFGSQAFRSLFFIPQITSAVAIAMIWKWLYQPIYGLLNQLLQAVALPQIGFLTSPRWAMPSLITMGVWSGIGMPIIIFLAGLTAIPRHLYEAAKIDGANTWQMFRWLTLPLLMPTITFVLVTGFMGAFNVFGSVFVLTRGGPLNATRVLSYHIYETAFVRLKMGEASGVAFILFVIVLAITFVQLKVTQVRWEY